MVAATFRRAVRLAAVARVRVEELHDAVRVGDLAVPLPMHTLHDVAFVDLGEASGVEEGDELLAVLPPDRSPRGVRPEIVVARLRVVRVAPESASVKVIGLEHSALRPGLPVRAAPEVP